MRANLPGDIRVNTFINHFPSHGFFRRMYDILRAPQFQGDVNHVTGDVHYLTYLLDKRRTVLTILDCVTLERLTGIKRWLLWLMWYWLPEKRCTAIVVISEATRDQVLRHLRCRPSKIQVIYCSVSEEFEPAPQPFNSARPRILHVGTSLSKNVIRHIEALAGLNCDFVVVGELSSIQIRVMEDHQITYQNYTNLTREELVEQYYLCDMVLFASIYEGFGLPIVEANAVGRPVVTSNIWSMPEVAGNAACLVNPYDVSSIRAGVCRIIDDAAYRESLVMNGFENIKRFKIDKIAEQYAELYRRVQSSSNRNVESRE